jgi:hypothetical protein
MEMNFKEETSGYIDARDEAYHLRVNSARELLSDLLPQAAKGLVQKRLDQKPAVRIFVK